MNDILNIDNEPVEKSSLRKRADKAKKHRSRSLICVLENPTNIANVAATIRNIDALGVTKLYVISTKKLITEPGKKGKRSLNSCSASADKYVYTHYFSTTDECFQYLEQKKYISLVTSPHVKDKENFELLNTDFTKYKKLAIWFGNEANGITDEAVTRSNGCVQIEMAGIVESMNLSVATGIVLNHIASQRRNKSKYYKLKKELRETGLM